MDYEKLADTVYKARVVGVGESTHGSFPFFNLKVKLFKVLVEKYGFDTFVLEDRKEQCRAINEYIRGSGAALGYLIMDLYPVWNTQELEELIEWCRAHFAEYPVTFIGCDIIQTDDNLRDRDEYMARNIIEYIEKHESAKAFVWAHNTHIKRSGALSGYPIENAPRSMGSFLGDWLGKDYIAVGQFFGTGQFNATIIKDDDNEDRSLSVVTLSDKPVGLFEEELNKISTEPFFLSRENMVERHFDKEYVVRSIGWGVKLDSLEIEVEQSVPADEFDYVTYFPVSTNGSALQL